jgi:hypothetical protein
MRSRWGARLRGEQVASVVIGALCFAAKFGNRRAASPSHARQVNEPKALLAKCQLGASIARELSAASPAMVLLTRLGPWE